MQAQQSKPAKPTVGQIMAAKRAKKRDQEIERIRLNHIGTELPADIKQLLYKYTQKEFGK